MPAADIHRRVVLVLGAVLIPVVTAIDSGDPADTGDTGDADACAEPSTECVPWVPELQGPCPPLVEATGGPCNSVPDQGATLCGP